MKSLKTRNKSPVHYKYTWQRCTNQSFLFAEGFSGQSQGSACPAPAVQCGHHGPRHAEPVTPGHSPGSSWEVTSTQSLQDSAGALSVSQPPTGVYHVENMLGIWHMDLCTQIPEHTGSLYGTYIPGLVCKTERRGNQHLLYGFYFFLMQLFNLSS